MKIPQYTHVSHLGRSSRFQVLEFESVRQRVVQDAQNADFIFVVLRYRL